MKTSDLFWLAVGFTAVVMAADKGGSRGRKMPYHDEYTDDERNKQLEIYRDLADDDKRWADRCSSRVNQLIRSLAPEDGSRDLFTFFERKAFDIPVTHRPRPKE